MLYAMNHRRMIKMAQRVTQTLVSDLSGSEVDVSNIEFGLDGVEYEIDLDSDEEQKLRDALAEYIGHARRTGRATRSTTRQSPGRRTGAAMTRHPQAPRPEKGRSKE